MPRAYRYDCSTQALYRPAEGPGFFEDWTPKDLANDDLLCAEMSRLAYASPSAVATALPKIGFTLGKWLGGTSLRDRIAMRGTEGFVARHAAGGLTVVAIRGTESNKPEDLLADLLTGAVNWPGRGHVHKGFAHAFEPVRDTLRDEIRPEADNGHLLITGHSLGAGVATLAAADLEPRHPTLVTFGSPRVGDPAFVRSMGTIRVRRLVNCCDVVTRIPPERFTQANIGTLLEELTGEGILSSGLGRVMAGALAPIGFDPRFEHLAPARYIDQFGTPNDALDDAGRQTDQASARRDYLGARAQHPGIASVLSRITSLGFSAHDVFDVVPQAMRGVLNQMTGNGQNVPLRDLADHAPINYVSSFTGRLP